MKKQIFILMMALLAISFSSVYGQVTPRGITCLTADHLNPVAGQAYTYSITVPTPATGTNNVLWFVTQDINFIAGGNLTANRALVNGNLLAAAGAGYNVSTAGQYTMSLTWKNIAYNAANPIFVVMNVVNDNGTCNPNNLKVYEIKPQNTFTLDIANINATGVTLGSDYGANIDNCIASIVSATYNTTSHNVEYDYGQNVLLYEVTAANWTGQWRPSVQLTGINANESVTVEWSTTRDFAVANTMTGSPVGTGAVPATYTSGTNVGTATGSVVGTAGSSIFIRVTLDHTVPTLMYEGLTNEVVALAVDGVLYSETTPGNGVWTVAGLGDVHFNNGTPVPGPCTAIVVDNYANDIATQTVLARPNVVAGTPTPFLTPVPAP